MGLFGTGSEFKYIGSSFYLMNYLSIKAQEIYNYPLLPNSEYVYSIYGYNSDITNYIIYAFLFLFGIFSLYLIRKPNRMFFS